MINAPTTRWPVNHSGTQPVKNSVVDARVEQCEGDEVWNEGEAGVARGRDQARRRRVQRARMSWRGRRSTAGAHEQARERERSPEGDVERVEVDVGGEGAHEYHSLAD